MIKNLVQGILLFVSISGAIAQPSHLNPAFLNQGQQWADSVLGTLSQHEKIGQLFMVDAYSREDQINREKVLEQIRKYEVGGVIFFAGHPNVQMGLTREFQKASSIPLMIAMDAEYGAAMRLDSTIQYPYNMTLGAINNPDMIYQLGSAIGRELKSLGVHINFAPDVDVNNNPKNPVINWRSFGDDPDRVAQMGLNYMKGLQQEGVLAVAKHFPGHGDTDVDSHKDLPGLPFSRERLDSVELVPFRRLINEGVGGIMAAHMHASSIDADTIPTSLSGKVINGILRQDLGFQGLVFSDALNMKGITRYHSNEDIAVQALVAGNDVLLFPENLEEAIAGIQKALSDRQIEMSLIEEKVRKILLAKYWFGLSGPINTPLRGKFEVSRENMLIQRQLIEKSVTLLRNQDQFLPLRRLDTLQVASVSVGADDLTLFQDRLDDYMSVAHFQMTADASAASFDQLRKQLAGYDLVLIGLHQVLKYPWSRDTYGAEVYEWIDAIAKDKAVVVSHFRNPYLLGRVALPHVEALLTTYQDGDLYQDYAAQLIFGGIGASGRLPVNVSEDLKRGVGVATQGNLRFRYSIPEAIGIDGELLEGRIDSVMKIAMDSGAFPGAQILLAKDKTIFYHKSYGHHTYERNQRVDEDDLYDLASITKVTGATAGLMKLHDQGLFDLDATLSDYMPYFRWSNKRNLTFRDILTHNARLKPWIAYYQTATKRNGKYRRKTLATERTASYSVELTENLFLHEDYKKKIYKMIRKSPLNEQEGYQYSGLAFYLFPDLISERSGSRYPAFLHDTFFAPLGASSITFNPYQKFDLSRIVPTEQDDYFRNTLLHGVVHDEGAAMMDGISGNAGLFSNANDLAKMWQMYMDFGSYGGEEYLTYQTMQKFSICQYCEEGNKRALGFDKPDLTYDPLGSSVAKLASPETFGHSGYTGTLVWADPEADLLFVFLSNRVYPTRDNRKIYTMNVRPDIHNIVYNLLSGEN